MMNRQYVWQDIAIGYCLQTSVRDEIHACQLLIIVLAEDFTDKMYLMLICRLAKINDVIILAILSLEHDECLLKV